MIIKGLKYEYSEVKNKILKSERKVSFEEVIDEINADRVLEDYQHPNKLKYPNQSIFLVRIRGYICKIPYVEDKKRQTVFLKTIYHNRTANKKYEKR